MLTTQLVVATTYPRTVYRPERRFRYVSRPAEAEGASHTSIDGTLPELKLGEIHYPLLRPLPYSYVPHTGEFYSELLGRRFLGVGATIADARRDFISIIHRRFQDLFGRTAFELSADDRADWLALVDWIDVSHYLTITPIRVREIGRVVQTTQRPHWAWRVAWEHGGTDLLTAEQLAPEVGSMNRYGHSKCFEAIVDRDRQSAKLLRVVWVSEVTPSLKETSPEEEELWERIKAQSPPTRGTWNF